MTSDYRKKFFTDVFDNNRWNSSESASGQGSETWATQDLVRDLPLLFEKYGIESMLDAPCGDFHWMRNVVDRSQLKYTGADIVDSMIESNQANFGNPTTGFEVLDIAVDPLPAADLVFVRDLFIHLSLDLISNCLKNIARSDFKYVMLTHDSLDARYPPAGNVEIDDGNNGPVEHGVNFLFRADRKSVV